jgi:hypothetical protein
MKLSQLRKVLESHPEKFPRFVLPDGDQVPAHFHLTEVGHVTKNFIDCGGTIRKTESGVLQLWVNDSDADHRLTAGRMAKILALGQRVLPQHDLEIEVEYDDCAISQFPLTGIEISGHYLDFTMTTKHTDCLAREKCGVDDSCCATEPTAAAYC